MAIRTYQYCDMCEAKFGVDSEKAQIVKDVDCPAFPQMIWTYFKKSLAIGRQDGEKLLFQHWVGNPNRLEFCEEHGMQFNVLLKAFAKEDSRLTKILDNLVSEDRKQWAQKQEAIQKEFDGLKKKEGG